MYQWRAVGVRHMGEPPKADRMTGTFETVGHVIEWHQQQGLEYTTGWHIDSEYCDCMFSLETQPDGTTSLRWQK